MLAVGGADAAGVLLLLHLHLLLPVQHLQLILPLLVHLHLTVHIITRLFALEGDAANAQGPHYRQYLVGSKLCFRVHKTSVKLDICIYLCL